MSTHSNPSRRTFLKGSATVAAAASEPGGQPEYRPHGPRRGQRPAQGGPHRLRRARHRRGRQPPRRRRRAGRRREDHRRGRRLSPTMPSGPADILTKHYPKATDIPAGADLRRLRRLPEGDRQRRRYDHHGHFARLPPDPLQGGRRGRARTSSWKSPAAPTPPATARCWRPTSWPTRRISRSAWASSAATPPATWKPCNGSTTA